MLNLIPSVKFLEIKDGFFEKKGVFFGGVISDNRLLSPISKLPKDKNGADLKIVISEKDGEGYEIYIEKESIKITADSSAGAFYALQTLRQIFTHDRVPCLYIKDCPDFKYRGFYHDVTRGKVPRLDTLKAMIDNMAYYKLNALQLYVEHVFEFKEYKDLNERLGYLTKEEIEELDRYCYENFIEFEPSLSTFGHLFELLNQNKYKHLNVLKDHVPGNNFWDNRMGHYTIDPLNDESIEVIKSLIDQYIPHFKTDNFNICCDETFDLNFGLPEGSDVGSIYCDFVKKIIAHLKQKNKTVMMWADILLKYPETITDIPDDTVFLNWEYDPQPDEEKIKKFADLGRTQIICPGTTTWNRLCEKLSRSLSNIDLSAKYGHKHGALGILNTNWGDWGNPCSIELAMFGLVWGAEKSWSVATELNDGYCAAADHLVYEKEGAYKALKAISELEDNIYWCGFCRNYIKHRFTYEGYEYKSAVYCDVSKIQSEYKRICEALKAPWKNDEYRKEMLIAAEGICVIAELNAKITGEKLERITNTERWLQKFRSAWTDKNKESELRNIEEMFKVGS